MRATWNQWEWLQDTSDDYPSLILAGEPSFKWWQQPPAAHDPEWRAIGKGAGAAVLVMWCNVAAISVVMSIMPRPEPGRLSGAAAILGPLFLGSLLALIVGGIGGVFGALLGYNLRRLRRRSGSAASTH